MVKHITREFWLEQAVMILKPIFTKKGYSVPDVRISCAIPSSWRPGSAIGQCWPSSASKTGKNEIFICPSLSDQVQVLDTLVHELVHAVDDCKSGHGKEFKEIALSVGLEGKMREARAGETLKQNLRSLAKILEQEFGAYPHEALQVGSPIINVSRKTPQAICESCGYKISVFRKFVLIGAPLCPKDKTQMKKIGDWSP